MTVDSLACVVIGQTWDWPSHWHAETPGDHSGEQTLLGQVTHACPVERQRRRDEDERNKRIM